METDASPSRLESHLGYWLRHVSNHVSGAFARALEERQVSVAEWVVLVRIDEARRITPGELASLTGMTRGAISKVLDKLEAKGWIKRESRQQDLRAQDVVLTGGGKRLVPKLAAIADANDHHFFDVLTAEQQTTLRRLLDKIVQHHGMHGTPIE